MGSSDSNAKDIDSSVGGLVWVRRRNGSWWPGRILGLDEISEGSLVSPRSGTPVKLLGREDASVDWYNLEKSKRVKAFRCGEYDDCIEKARANAATGNKKTVKYARREDAILHALEIENDQLGKNHVDASLSNNSGGELGISPKESPIISDSHKEDAGDTNEGSDLKAAADSHELKEDSEDSRFDSDSGSAPELSRSGLSFEEPNRVGPSKVQYLHGKRRKTPNDSEDEGIKRMRGLEDLGMVIGDSNAISNGSPMKRKRTQVPNVHELLKRKNRRRPLTKVLESTAVVSIPVVCDQLINSNGSPLHGLSESKVSEIESNESRKSVSVAANNNSDSTGVSCENGVSLNPSEHACDAPLINCKFKEDNDVAAVLGFAENESSDRLFDVPFAGEEKNSAGTSPVIVCPSTRHEDVPLINECGSTSSAAALINNISQRMEKGTSKWQLKGKRNSRHTSQNRKPEKRKYMALDNNHDSYLPATDHLDGRFADDHVENFTNWGKSRFIVNSKFQTSETITESKLYDVKIDVKANYQPQNVPLISLTSKLNGKAIIGHPLTVKLLADELACLPIQNARGKRVPTKLVRHKRRRSESKSKSARRRKSGMLSKKIRKLSSLTNKEKCNKAVVEKVKGGVIACVPLKVVFGRISEAVNGSAR